MALAFFAGAYAQEAQEKPWSMTLGSAEGLPGNDEKIEIDGVEKTYAVYQTLPIRLSEPTKTLRMTVYGVNNGTKQDGKHLLFTLSEVKVHTADMQGVYNYTATSNADHNTLKQDADIPLDGQGIPALNDGDNTTYFHSLWDHGVQTTDNADYHWLEFEFETEIQEFVLELNGRFGRTDQMPTTIVLTKGGVTVEPYANTKFEVKEQVTTLEALKNTPYIVMRGNASEKYTIYDHAASKPGALVVSKDKDVEQKDLEGTGPMYYSQQGTRSKEVSIAYVVQLIPVKGKENTFLVYYPEYDKYMGTKGFAFDIRQGWQQATAYEDEAAEVKIIENGAGDFEMSYELVDDQNNTWTVCIGADPRQGVHGMKVLEQSRKEFLVVNSYCEKYGIKAAFNWTFFEATYETPEWTSIYKFRKLGDQLTEMKAKFDGIEGYTLQGVDYTMEYNFTSVFDGIIAEIKTALQEGIGNDEIVAKTKVYKQTIHNALKAIIEEEAYVVEFEDYDDKGLAELMKLTTPGFTEGAYDVAVYETCIQANILNRIADLVDLSTESDIALYNHINDVATYFKEKGANIASFEASKYEVKDFSFLLETRAAALGQIVEVTNPANEEQRDSRYVWERSIKMKEAVNGFRMTFVDTNTKGGHHFYKGYPLIALAELEIYDGDGNKLELNDELVTTNSVCLRKDDTTGDITEDGSVKHLFDEDYATYYHSMWSDKGGTFDPVDTVYLDVKFPQGTELTNFKIKTIARYQADYGTAPRKIRFTAYGEKYNPAFERPNTYNVTLVEQIEDPEDITEGLYIIKGNLNANNPYNTADPFYYSGRDHFHTRENVALNDTCVYALEADGEGWNIKSLSHGQYWTVDGGMTLDKNKAAKIMIAKSESEYNTQIENAMVLYSVIPDTTITAEWKWDGDKNLAVNIPKQEITVNKMVYMDWYNGLNSRLCVSEQPGVFEYGYEEIISNDYFEGILMGQNLEYQFDAGDNLHFNKTNGEGEWCIYRVTMDNPEFVYLKGVVNNTIVSPTWAFGKNPGQRDITEEDLTAYNEAKATAELAIEERNMENAATYAKNLADEYIKIEAVEPVKITYKGKYAVISAYDTFREKNGVTRAWYVNDEENVRWGNTPDEFTNEYVFEFEKIGSANHEAFGSNKNYEGKAYWIRSLIYDEMDVYLAGTGTTGGTPAGEATEENPTGTGSSNMSLAEGKSEAKAFVVDAVNWGDVAEANKKYQKDDIFTISEVGSGTLLHANAHMEGEGVEGALINWSGADQYASKSVWRLILIEEGTEDPEGLIITSVEEILGEEVVATEIYTPAGVAVPELVKGINIVIKHYANGAVEATKVLVK